MKDLKSLKPTEICIRATEENAEFIVSLLEKLGGEWDYGDDRKIDNPKEHIGMYYFMGSLPSIAWCREREIKSLGITEITLEQLRELAGVKEPQTERITLKDTGWMPTFREEANEHLKQLLTFQTDLNEHINSVVQKLATLEAVKSENESLKECLKEYFTIIEKYGEGQSYKHSESELSIWELKSKTLLK